MTILLSNDDGVASEGLAELYRQLSSVVDCIVYAPDRDRSGSSSSLTLDRPLRLTRQSNGFFSIDGTPADCVHLALNLLLTETPSRVISGINQGANLGDDVLYSGTVAAALEGRFMNNNAIAFSVCGTGTRAIATAGKVAKELFLKLDHLKAPKGTILNVNIPACDFNDILGMKVTRLGHREKPNQPVKTTDPRGRSAYWIASLGAELDAGIGTDFHAVSNGYISITPLQYDQTHHETLSIVEEWLEANL
ncbi:MAG: 5'/3'-nucleotidase SurE [Candidatus Endonucleobacter bathymodioli]|uniref:5'-nucleotidase SurE n=1 Tax=Candidatus Endonucleibacter bathymodioli TaxID=539814 RepID=A0AA90NJR1_9GAMM|nr:5'/3'-nucleotidase SurE [Candidatus Endonucleobacter bathymodioli]